MRRTILGLLKASLTLLPITAAALLPASGDAFGQIGLTYDFGDIPSLTQSDLAIMRKLVREGLTGKPDGTTLSWSNPESQNSGTVQLLQTFPSQGRDCRRVQYVVKPGPNDEADVDSYVLTNCRLADGKWRLDADAKPD
ncbi:MAG: hypothetical protein JO255_13615 [Alphaproteobacteria bacterium]|nr:hypothetical protein [Alphaproteobacteria bacterium]